MKKKQRILIGLWLFLLAIHYLLIPTMSYRAESTQQPAVMLAIRPEQKEPSGQPKWSYYSGEDIKSYADLSVSGVSAPIDNARVRISIAKENVNPYAVQFTQSNAATRWERGEDATTIFADYYFDRLAPGQYITLPFFFRWHQYNTHHQFVTEAQIQVFDGAGVLKQEVKAPYTALAQTLRLSQQTDRERYVYYPENTPLPTHTKAGSEAPVSSFSLSWPEFDDALLYGRYMPKTIKIVNHLPQGAVMAGTPNEEGLYPFRPYHSREGGWRYDADTHTATYEGPYGSGGELAIRLAFPEYPFRQTIRNRMTIEVDSGTAYARTLPETTAEAQLIPRTEETVPETPNVWRSWVSVYKRALQNIPYDESVRGSAVSVPFDITTQSAHSGDTAEEAAQIQGHAVQEILDQDLDNRLYYHAVTLKGSSEAVRAAIARSSNRVIGVRVDGSEQTLEENIAIDAELVLDDRQQHYKKIVVRFDEPIALQGDAVTLRVSTRFTDDAWVALKTPEHVAAKLVDVTNGYTVRYREQATEDKVAQGTATATVVFEGLRIRDDLSSNQRVVYGTNRNPSVRSQAHIGGYGKLDRLRHITLLPEGVNYVARSSDANQVTVVQNYRDTGKTAVIHDLGSVTVGMAAFQASYDVNFDGITTEMSFSPHVPRGMHAVEQYIVWDGMGHYLDIEGSYGKKLVVDTKDIDGDGLVNDYVLYGATEIEFVPPHEIIAVKHVSTDRQFWSTTSAVTTPGSTAYYRVSVVNNSVVPQQNVTLLDVLPHVGDHTIVANKDGQYTPRQSVFPVRLAASLESISENQALLDKWDVTYSTTPQGADLASVRDAAFVPVAQIADFSQVTHVRIQMKSGIELAQDESATFVLPVTVPHQQPLNAGDRAVNTVALSWDGQNYVEANAVSLVIGDYEVTGRVFNDSDRNGVQDAFENGLANRTVQLMNEDGTLVVDAQGEPVQTVTNELGQYFLNVPRLGTYYVRVDKPESDSQLTRVVGTGASENANHGSQDPQHPEYGKSDTFAVTPADNGRPIIRNFGYLPVWGVVTVHKVDSNNRPVAQALFELTVDGVVHDTVRTDGEGLARFTQVPFGTHQLRETEVPENYELDDEVKSVTVDANQPVAVVHAVNRNKAGGRVTLQFITQQGQTIRNPQEIMPTGTATGTPYQVSPPQTIVVSGQTYELKEFASGPGHAPENGQVVVTPQVVTAVYWRKNRGKVSVQHIDEFSGKVLATEINEGEAGTLYHVASQEFDGYLFHRVTGNPDGMIQEGETESVRFYYRKKVPVTYRFVDETGRKIADDQVVDQGVGTLISREQYKQFPSAPYTYLRTESTTGTAHEDIAAVVTHVYRDASKASVRVEHINEHTWKTMADPVIVHGTVGQPYTTMPVTLPHYRVTRIEGDATGTFVADDEPIITYYYDLEADKGQLTVLYVRISTSHTLHDEEKSIGTVGEAYQTMAKDIPGYHLVETYGETNGTYQPGENNVVYYYGKDNAPGRLLIDYEEEDSGTLIAPQDVVTGNDGERYRVQSKAIPNYVFLYANRSEEGVFTADEEERITYYYARAHSVTVRYIDEQGKELKPNKVTAVLPDTEHTEQAIAIDGYEPGRLLDGSVTPSSEWRQTVTGDVTVTFQYRALSEGTVTVRYVDEHDQPLHSPETVSGTHGTAYRTEAKQIDGYSLLETQGSEQGTFAATPQTVTYVYRKEAAPVTGTVTVRYVAADGSPIADSDTLTGVVGTPYQTQAKEVTGYRLVRTEGPNAGNYATTEQSVVYHYEAVPVMGTVTVRYVAADGSSIADSDTLTGEVGTPYQTQAKEVTGYRLVRTEGPNAGNYATTEQSVVYHYEAVPVMGTVTVRYVDDAGLALLPDVVLTEPVGTAYQTTPQTISQYQLDGVEGTATGQFTEQAQTVVYRYRRIPELGNVLVRHVDEHGQSVYAEQRLTGAVGTAYQTEAQAIDGYELERVSGAVSGAFQSAEQVATYHYRVRVVPPVTTGVVRVHYVNEQQETIHQEDVLSGTVGSEYQSQARDISGYQFVRVTGAAQGQFQNQEQQVTYHYIAVQPASGSVMVYYRDENGQDLAPSEQLSGPLGSGYQTTAKQITGYQLVQTDGAAQGTYQQTPQDVVYRYTRAVRPQSPVATGKLTVRYIDEQGNVIETTLTDEQDVDTAYATVMKPIAGYELVRVEGAQSGHFGTDDTVVTYVYRKVSDGTSQVAITEVPVTASSGQQESVSAQQVTITTQQELPQTGHASEWIWQMIGLWMVCVGIVFYRRHMA